MILLSVESENGAVLTYRLAKGQVSVGSSSRNDVVVRAPGVGERHLVIHRNNDVFTFVTVDRQTVVLNGERRSRGVLNPGDKLRLGGLTLVFRGLEGNPLDLVESAAGDDQAAPSAGPVSSPGAVLYRLDPAGFGEARQRLVELFRDVRGDRLNQVVAILRETLPESEIAVVVPGEKDEPVALASVWGGELPRLPRSILGELSPGARIATIGQRDGQIIVVPVIGPQGALAALLLARPAGMLADEGVGLLGEAARLLGLRWQDIERDDATFSGWELEARHRLENLLPGSSQATQVLRSGLLAAAHGHEPVLVCGAKGTGRTEVARILATIGPLGVRSVTIFEAREGPLDALREELFGPARRPTFGTDAGGAIGRAKGGVLVIRGIDTLGLPLQSELAAVIGAQQREPLSSNTVRWVVTCDEDPLALVQQGRLASPLFLVFSHRMLRVPRLSERREDLPMLIAHLMRRCAAGQQKQLKGITLDCLNVLLTRGFPGEMTELVSEVSRLVTATPEGEMLRCDGAAPAFAGAVTATGEIPPELLPVLSADNLKEAIPRVEQALIDRVMRRVRGNQSKGARILGISRGALIAKLKEYAVPDYRYLRRRKGGAA
ncbi:MAG: helix-turn-helix domain-containing protein [Acidobacteriota bacterium]